MVRAFSDKTSTCATCTFWDSSAPGLQPQSGYCGYESVPAWVRKHLPPQDAQRIITATEGLDCWQHSKRHTADCAAQDSEFGACTCEGAPAQRTNLQQESK